MVQRKVPNKLGIQADHVKSEKRLGNLKPSSYQHQDGKNRGADLKKKMKKSRSFKRSDFESLRSPTLRPQPGKPPPPPPPLDVPATAASPQKQSPIKASDGSPNYMKSTSSFDARKERTQVSSRNFQTATYSKSPSTKNSDNSKLSSASGHKMGRTSLPRTSSLKLVRTLTKSPSFKPVRAMVKKSSQVALCEDLNVKKATCSSTLKNSKFPSYLTLNPGGTESEGTSAMKVCPYTYCSLNGHHHPPLPPLKCFLSARRHMLKTQKSVKLGCLSPRRAKPSDDGILKEIDERPAIQEPDLNSSVINPLIQEESMDFFIEIYIKNREDSADTIGRCKHNGDDQDTPDFSVNDIIMPSVDDSAAEHGDRQVMENLSDAEASDMEWEEGPYSAPYLDDEIDHSIQTNNKSDLESGYSLEADNPSFHDEPIFKSDDIVSSCINENPANEVLQESVSFDSMFCDSDSESDGSYQNLESDESIQVFDNQSPDQLSPTHDASEELTTTEERDRNTELDDCVGTAITLATIKGSTEQPTAAGEEKNGASEADDEIPRMNLQVGDDKTEYTSGIEDEVLTDHQENEDLQESNATVLQGNHQQSDLSHDFTGQDQDKTYKDYTASHNIIEVEQFYAAIGKCQFGEEVFDESLLPRTKDSDADPNRLEQELPTADAVDGMEEGKQVDAAKSTLQVTFDLLQGISEADQDTTEEDDGKSQIDAIAQDSKSNQAFADEGLSAETQDDSSDKQSQSNNVAENQKESEKDRDAVEKFKILSSLNSQDHTHSGINEFRLEENSNQDVDKMEVEERTKSDAEETCPTAKITTGTETKNALLHAGSNSNQELLKTCSNPRGTIRFKRPIEDSDETREFNPREPNYLPVEPDPEAEKVDLRHQMMDDKKNAEEWMLDYALQQTVTKLAPARKRKVALLVEAFETVMPIPKYETRLRHTSAAFAHARPIQACN
uniref:Calmodulin-binding domain-containing protein n=1 Tax=Davidia involucrata TaxID=16924 RepID=A0A5B6YJQ7_DAVIN